MHGLKLRELDLRARVFNPIWGHTQVIQKRSLLWVDKPFICTQGSQLSDLSLDGILPHPLP